MEGKSLPDRILITDTQRGEYLTKNQPYVVMSQRWRLVNGKELYEIEKDPEQRQNIASLFPDTIAVLQQAYEKWWQENAAPKSDYQRFIVGSLIQKVVCLTSHDLHVEKGLPTWNQDMVESEIGTNGFWAIEVTKSGIYEFELRRFPREHKAIIPAKYKKAKIFINNDEQEKKITGRTRQVSFEVRLPQGKHQLQTWFLEDSVKSIEAAYVYVKQIKK
jgi:hypothetical protein